MGWRPYIQVLNLLGVFRVKTHYWPEKYKGDAGRVQHDPNNFFEPTKTEWRYIKKALKYNEKHKNDKPWTKDK